MSYCWYEVRNMDEKHSIFVRSEIKQPKCKLVRVNYLDHLKRDMIDVLLEESKNCLLPIYVNARAEFFVKTIEYKDRPFTKVFFQANK